MRHKSALTNDDMAEIPGLDLAVYFGNPGDPVRDWRVELPPSSEGDEEPTPEEKECLKQLIGFDYEEAFMELEQEDAGEEQNHE